MKSKWDNPLEQLAEYLNKYFAKETVQNMRKMLIFISHQGNAKLNHNEILFTHPPERLTWKTPSADKHWSNEKLRPLRVGMSV